MFDNITGLSNHWNRWYDPKLGKWISEDPIGFAAGDTNLGRYVGNDATRSVDPYGLYSSSFRDPTSIQILMGLIDQVTNEMLGDGGKKNPWTAENPKDKGAYGKAFSDKLRELIAKQELPDGVHIYTGVLVETEGKNKGVIKELDAHHGTKTAVEVDILVSGKKLEVGDKIDPKDVEFFEFKATEDGYVTQAQRKRLELIKNTPDGIFVPGAVWDRKSNTVKPNPKATAATNFFKIWQVGGIVVGVAVFINSDKAEAYDELRQLGEKVKRIDRDPVNGAMDRGSILTQLHGILERLGVDADSLHGFAQYDNLKLNKSYFNKSLKALSDMSTAEEPK